MNFLKATFVKVINKTSLKRIVGGKKLCKGKEFLLNWFYYECMTKVISIYICLENFL